MKDRKIKDRRTAESKTDDNNDDTENKDDKQNKNDNDEEKIELTENGISNAKQDMKSAFALFENNQNIDNNNNDRIKHERKPTITKKGKRYFDFKEFASGAFSIVYKAKDKQNGDKIVAIKRFILEVH